MQAAAQPQRAPDGAPFHYERHRPERTALHPLVQQHAASFIAHTEASTGADLPHFVKDAFDAFLECGILAHGFSSLRLARVVSSAGFFEGAGATGRSPLPAAARERAKRRNTLLRIQRMNTGVTPRRVQAPAREPARGRGHTP